LISTSVSFLVCQRGVLFTTALSFAFAPSSIYARVIVRSPPSQSAASSGRLGFGSASCRFDYLEARANHDLISYTLATPVK